MKWRPNSLLLITLFLKDPGGRLWIVQGTIMGKLKHKKIPLKTIGLHFSDMWDIFQGVGVLTSRKLHSQITKEKPIRVRRVLPPGLGSDAVRVPLPAQPASSTEPVTSPSFICLAFPSFLTMVPFRCESRQTQEGGGSSTGERRRRTQRSWNWQQSWGCICFRWGRGGISFLFFSFLTLGWGSIPNRNLCLLGSDICKPLRAFCIGTVRLPALLLCRG